MHLQRDYTLAKVFRTYRQRMWYCMIYLVISMSKKMTSQAIYCYVGIIRKFFEKLKTPCLFILILYLIESNTRQTIFYGSDTLNCTAPVNFSITFARRVQINHVCNYVRLYLYLTELLEISHQLCLCLGELAFQNFNMVIVLLTF